MTSHPLIAVSCLALLLHVHPGAAAQGSPAPDSLGEARQLAEKGELNSAEALVRKVLAQSPQSAAALLVLGGVLERRGDLAGATDAYERAIVEDPKSATAHDKLGFVLGRQNRVQDALAAFSRAIELDPKYFDAQYHL
ncbi:MAG: tetratricopeptide repeat protein, partial [Acidobacteria bacterium]|nr:tetratricopeptide repeat protein [Acidobacteriota bacterium]